MGYQAFDGSFIFLLLPSNTSSYLNVRDMDGQLDEWTDMCW